MLEQNLKGQYRRAYLDYSRHRKENCPGKVLCVVNFAALCNVKPSVLKSHAGEQGTNLCSVHASKKVDVRDILDWITR